MATASRCRKLYQVFGNELDRLLDELNKVLVA